jgi:hypothetical protein
MEGARRAYASTLAILLATLTQTLGAAVRSERAPFSDCRLSLRERKSFRGAKGDNPVSFPEREFQTTIGFVTIENGYFNRIA